MKRIKQIAAALCATDCTFTTAFADESGLESATPPAPVITDPINPQPGMIYSAYSLYEWMEESDQIRKGALEESLSNLPKEPSLKTGVDKNEKFIIDCTAGVTPSAIRWEGFLKCTMSNVYTFVIKKKATGYEWHCGYAIRVNGKFTHVSWGESSFDAELKTGFNKVEIVTLLPKYNDVRTSPLFISAKPKGSIIEPVQLSPGMLFYDHRPELEKSGL